MTNKEVINFLDQVRKIILDDKSWLESTIQPINEAFDMAISALQAQDLQPTCNQLETDTISRRATIDAVLKESNTDGAYGYMDTKSIVDLLNEQPSAQPDYTAIKSEIITNIEEFNDAKHHAQWVQDNGKMIAFGLELALRIIEEKERRTDGEETDRKTNH